MLLSFFAMAFFFNFEPLYGIVHLHVSSRWSLPYCSRPGGKGNGGPDEVVLGCMRGRCVDALRQMLHNAPASFGGYGRACLTVFRESYVWPIM